MSNTQRAGWIAFIILCVFGCTELWALAIHMHTIWELRAVAWAPVATAAGLCLFAGFAGLIVVIAR